MSEGRTIQVAAVEEAQLLGGKRIWNRIDADTLHRNLQELLDNLRESLPSDDDTKGGFRTTQIQVAVTVGAKGEVGILGTGVEVSGQAALTLTLSRD